MKRRIAALAVAAIAPLALTATPVNANDFGDSEGCTPGYWKNHTDSWQEADPSKSYTGKFASGAQYSSVSSLTQLQALDGGGGPGLNGAARILARASMAAYLNAAVEGIEFPWRRNPPAQPDDIRPRLVPAVDAAFDSRDRSTMLDLATRLDADNNLGCPLT